MVLNKLSKSLAAVATAGMMVANPMMAMAAGSPEVPPTPAQFNEKGTAEVVCNGDELVSFTVVGNTDDGVCPITLPGGVAYLIIEDGQWNKNFSTTSADGTVVTPYEYDGQEWICDGGIIQTWTKGLVTDANGAYLVGAGRVIKDVDYTDYDGFWFALKNGRVDTSVNGPRTFMDHNGDEVTALFAAGRMLKEFTGVTDDPAGHVYRVVEGVIYEVIR